MKTGILGGSFDPVHLGHLLAARDALEQLSLDRVLLLPAPQAPLREEAPLAPWPDRVAMLEAAVAGESGLSVSLAEAGRTGPAYTIDTVEALRRDSSTAGDELTWIIGADHLPRLPAWHRIRELVTTVTFAVQARPGADAEVPDVPGLRLRWLSPREVGISSTEVRRRLSAGSSVRFLVPESVLAYIRTHRLYRTPATHA